jgi:hypothetical protein
MLLHHKPGAHAGALITALAGCGLGDDGRVSLRECFISRFVLWELSSSLLLLLPERLSELGWREGAAVGARRETLKELHQVRSCLPCCVTLLPRWVVGTDTVVGAAVRAREGAFVLGTLSFFRSAGW